MPKPKKLKKRIPRNRNFRGWEKVPKGIFEDPFFADHPLDEMSAFLFLRTEARATDAAITVRGSTFLVKAGQLTHSSEYLADRWGWTASAVKRFLTRLKIAGYIDLSNEHVQQIITITYDIEKQSGLIANEPKYEPATAFKRTLNGYNIKNNNNQKIEKNTDGKGTPKEVPSDPWINDLISEFGEVPIRSWFAGARLEGDELLVPTDTAKRYIEQLYGQKIKHIVGRSITVVVEECEKS